MLLRVGATLLSVLAAKSIVATWMMHDNFATCMTAQGTEYVVEPPDRCRPGDDESAVKCPMAI
jgi:hypothetical protein